MSEYKTPKVGQKWQDLDERMNRRTLVVVKVEPEHVEMQDSAGKVRRYLRRRLRPNNRGFVLVEDV